MSEPFKLYRLQQIDSQLDKSNNRLQEIVNLLKDDAELNAANSGKSNAERDLQSAEKELKRAEEDVAVQQIKVDQNQNRLYSGKVTNPKELQELQLEAEAFKRSVEKFENIQLEKMMNYEQLQQNLQQADQLFNQISAKVEAKNTNLVIEQSELNEDVLRLTGERESAIAGIPPEDLKLYESLREKRKGVAVSKVTDKSCSACGTNLPEALAQAARSPNKISQCTTCARILYSG